MRPKLVMMMGYESSIRRELLCMDSECIFYCDPSEILRGLPCNAEIDEALARIEELRREGKVQVVDTSQMNSEELRSAYISATMPAVAKKYRVRQILGTRRQAGFSFGRGVPVLLIQATTSAMPEDVFPHKKAGRIMTINEFLSRLTAV